MTERTLLFPDRPGSTAPTPPPGTVSVTRGLTLVMIIFILSRLLVWIGTYHGAFVHLRIEHRIDPPLEKHERQLQEQFAAGSGPVYETATELLNDFAPLCGFDGEHYQSIIDGGYHYEKPAPGETDPDKLEQNIAFFPLYPLLTRPLTQITSTHAAMILVAHFCSLLATVLTYLWVRQRIDHRTALLTVAVLLCWPTSVYYSYAYAEGVTLLTFTVALWLLDRGAYIPAAITCGIATASRPTALAITGVFALAYWFNRDEPRPRRLAKLIPLGAVAGAGILAYAGFLTINYGSPLVYFENFKAGWVQDEERAGWVAYLTLTPVWEQFKYFRNLVVFEPPIGLINAPNVRMWNMPLNLFIVFLSVAGLPQVPRRFRPLLLLGPLIFLHSYLASGGANFGIEPIARYMALSVPAFVVLAAWMRQHWTHAGQMTLFIFLILVQVAWAFRFGLREWSG